MQEAAKASKRPGLAGVSAAILLLGAYCGPLFASTSLPCHTADEESRHLDSRSLDLAFPELIISVTEHAFAAPTVVIESASNEQRISERYTAPEMAPRANAILKQIFDESYSAADLDELQPASATDAKSIAELALPPAPGEPAPDRDEAELPALDADLPGVSEDETLRYRRQMFRTDI